MEVAGRAHVFFSRKQMNLSLSSTRKTTRNTIFMLHSFITLSLSHALALFTMGIVKQLDSLLNQPHFASSSISQSLWETKKQLACKAKSVNKAAYM